jgi:GNAT superfamily N-acetyltransferase
MDAAEPSRAVQRADIAIRAAGQADFPRIREIEVAASQLFLTVGLDQIANDSPPSFATLATSAGMDGAFVACAGDVVVGYLLLEELGPSAHIEQVTVDPDFGRRGIGAGLIEFASGWAASRGLSELSLTTFEAVPWNAPYYRRLGFAVIAELDWPDEAVRRMSDEEARGLDFAPRVFMTRPVS